MKIFKKLLFAFLVNSEISGGFIKASAVHSRLFTVLCEEMGSLDTSLLLHSDIRWLSRENVLTRLINMRSEVQQFLIEKHQVYAHILTIQISGHNLDTSMTNFPFLMN